MTDLVSQLRGDPSDSLKQAAADQIERLRGLLTEAIETFERMDLAVDNKLYYRIRDELEHESEDEFERRAANLWREENPTMSVFDCDHAMKERYRARMREIITMPVSETQILAAAQALFDRTYERAAARGQEPHHKRGTHISAMPPSYRADYILDAKAALEAALRDTESEFERGKIVGKAIGWDAAKRDTSKIAQGWLDTFGKHTPEHVSAQKWASDAVRDILDNINSPRTK